MSPSLFAPPGWGEASPPVRRLLVAVLVVAAGALAVRIAVTPPTRQPVDAPAPEETGRRAAQFRRQAEAHVAADEPEKALIQYLNALREDASDTAARRGLADVYHDLQHWPEAVREYQGVVQADPGDCEAHARLAEITAAAGRPDLAVGHGQAACACDPTDVSARLLLAGACVATHQLDDARTALEAVLLHMADDDVDQLAAAGRLYLLLNDASAAEQAYSRGLAANSNHVPNLLGLATSYRLGGRAEAAEAVLQRVESIAPDNVAVAVQRAELELAAGDRAAAIALYRRVRQDAPTEYPASARLAQLLIDAGAVDEGMRLAAELTNAAEPIANGLGHFILARLHQAQGLYTLAIEHARGVLATNPEHVEARLLLAQAQVGKEQFAVAAETVDDLLRLAPAHETGLLLRARLMLLRGDEAAGVAAYREIAAAHPHSGLAEMALGNYCLQRGRAAEAIEHYDESLRRDPRNLVAANNLVMALLEPGGDHARALRLAQRLHARAPNSAAMADTLAWVHVQRGELDAALPLLRAAAAREPLQPDIRYHYGVALHRLGRMDAARAELTTALRLGDSSVWASDARRLLDESASE